MTDEKKDEAETTERETVRMPSARAAQLAREREKKGTELLKEAAENADDEDLDAPTRRVDPKDLDLSMFTSDDD